MNEIEAVDVSSLPNSIDFTSLKRFHKYLAPEVLLPYCKVFFYLIGCVAYRQYICFVFDIHVYFILFLHVFTHVNVSGRSGPFVKLETVSIAEPLQNRQHAQNP